MKMCSVFKFAIFMCFLLLELCYAILRKDPTVLVSLFVRNKAHTLPYFLQLFEQIDYPKDRMALWIKSDQNQDESLEIINRWILSVQPVYHSVSYELTPTISDKKNETIQTNWTEERFQHIIHLKEEALEKGKNIWADYIWYLDCDVFLTNNQTLKSLVNKSYPVVAPMLESLSLYSNFWCGMGVDFYYRRTDDYKPIREREKKGCFQVILVHSCFLVDLRQEESLTLTFKPENIKGYTGPRDDIITLAISAYWNDIPIYVCNEQKFGFIMAPIDEGQQIEQDYAQLVNVLLEASVDFPPMKPHPLLTSYVTLPPRDKLNFDEIFLINLERRPERLERMDWSFQQLGIDYKLIQAVDGKLLNDTYLNSLGIRMLPNFADPYHHRSMTMGEIGCFLSHYNIWKEIVDRQLEKSIIFEDDIRFEPHFRQKVTSLMDQVTRLKIDWDLIYLGRKRLHHHNESWVEGSDSLVHVDYSYWTLSYILSYNGAEKLLNGQPLNKLVPVDEYLPIMFDRHPENRWAEAFTPRLLKAYSAAPLLVYPTHYTGEIGYISDTEASDVVPDHIKSPLKENHQSSKGSKESISPKMQLDLSTSTETTLADLPNEIRTEL